jgi:hypothetical protein
MKCNHCRKEVNEKEVIRVYGRMITEYGCCTPDCYTKAMTGEPPLEESKVQN